MAAGKTEALAVEEKPAVAIGIAGMADAAGTAVGTVAEIVAAELAVVAVAEIAVVVVVAEVMATAVEAR